MAKETNEMFVPVSHWAVGRLADTSQVAIKLNDFSPILMSVEDAREIASALSKEANDVGQLMSSLPARSAGRAKQSPKK